MTTKTKKASRTRRTTAPAPVSTRLCPDPVKDERLRHWAGKVLSDLPTNIGDALIVLKYAERLVYWATMDDPLGPPMKRGRAAR